MAETADTRRCGSCGEAVGAAEALCPHCDALLAAYEAPSGSDVGSAAALSPVDMSFTTPGPSPAPTNSGPTTPQSMSTGYVSPVARAMETQRKAETPEFTTPALDIPGASPIAQAVKETRVAAEQKEQQTGIPAPSETPPTIIESRTQPQPVQRSAAQPQRQREPEKKRPPRREEPRPTPEVRAKRAQPLPVDSNRTPSAAVQRTREQHTKGWLGTSSSSKTGMSSNVMWIVVVLLGIVFLRILANSIGWMGLIFLIFAVLALVQWMRQLSKSSGRKTTNMPRDPRTRR